MSRTVGLYNKCLLVHVFCFRGKDFRQDFANIGHIRSLIPVKIHMMVLTATANYSTRATIIESLEMYSCHKIIHLPNNPNLYYSVLEKPWKCCSERGIESDRSIVFCCSYEEMMTLFQSMVLEIIVCILLTKEELEDTSVTNLMVVHRKIQRLR